MTTHSQIEAAYAVIETTADAVFDFDRHVIASIRGLSGHVRGAGSIELSDDASERAFECALDEATRTWEARRVCEDAIGVINGPDLQVLDAAVGVVSACVSVLQGRPRELIPPDVAYVVNTLAVRAQATAHEISALLRAGFPAGARARWRTLHEVAVVASVLVSGNRYTATRFKNHRWVMLARDLGHEVDPIDWPSGPTPDAMRRRLIRRYGPAYGGKYGWAADVTLRALGVAKPQWHHLEKTALLAEAHRSRVQRAHHSVHVDSLGGMDLVDPDGFLHAGGRLDGTREVVWQSVVALAEATDSLFAIWQRYDGAPLVVASRGYADCVLFELKTEVSRRRV